MSNPYITWTRRKSCDLNLADGHKLRVALESADTRWGRRQQAQFSREQAEYESRQQMAPFRDADYDDPDDYFETYEGPPPLSRLLLVHDDWDDARMRTDLTLASPDDFDSHHHHGLVHFIEQLEERIDELPNLLCNELIAAIRQTIFEFFPEASISPPPDDPDFQAYIDIHVEPAIEWLLSREPEDSPDAEFGD
jgi:hypothetical protein